VSLRFLTAGESHGPGLSVIVEGVPAGLTVTRAGIDADLGRRQLGYGRGQRMAIEHDRVEIRAGVRHGLTLGGPIALWIANRDHESWLESMSPDPVAAVDPRSVYRPRPGHADLAGVRKLEIDDARIVLERASARETAARVAAGAIAKAILAEIDVEVRSHVLAVGSVVLESEADWTAVSEIPAGSDFNCSDRALEAAMRSEVDRAAADGDTLGGTFEVIAHTPPPGLGHFVHWDRRIDGLLGQALLSIPAVKSVAIGAGAWAAAARGSAVHDVIRMSDDGAIERPTNRAGGIEGGMTNGEDVRVRVSVKPLATLRRPLESIDLRTGERSDAAVERSDVTVVPAAGVVGEAMVALVLARLAGEKFGADSVVALRRGHAAYCQAIGWSRADGAISDRV